MIVDVSLDLLHKALGLCVSRGIFYSYIRPFEQLANECGVSYDMKYKDQDGNGGSIQRICERVDENSTDEP